MQEEQRSSIAEELIAQERAVLDRWYRGDPMPFLENCAPSVTYFDPTVPQAINGYDALKAHLTPLTGKVMIDHYEIENPVVQLHGETAVLTFNCVVYIPQEDGIEKPMYNWNATEVYTRIDDRWKVIHSNWAYSKPVDSLV